MTIDPKSTWKEALEIIKISVSSGTFTTWFAQTHIVKISDLGKRYSIEVASPTAFSKNTIETRYFGLVQDSLSKVLGKPCDLVFSVKENPQKASITEDSTPLFATKKNEDEVLQALQRARIRPTFTFENFAVSSSNQMAHAAALAVSENLGSAYNPLFIWGGVGVGKTHLMVAVGNATVRRRPNLKVLFCTSETFTNDIVEGIRNKTTPEVRNKYRKLDLLMIDDIQFIAGKDTAQEEFFHTFNAVTSSGGQVILTSDRPPAEIAKLEERLRSRFEAGLNVDIAPPDFELRCAIAQIKARERNLPLDMEQIQIIAANLDSARKIEGALIKLMTLAGARGMEITNELVENIIGKGIESNVRPVRKDPAKVIDAVCRYYQVGKRAMLGESRARPVARPRQILMYLLRTDFGIPLEEVGRIVGGRDHTTVMHAVEKITQLATNDVQIREDMSKIKLGI
ncbi:MAG TPA: chromosomal replication initiator protein DnaA [Patescibacteria group bacterium]|nr:chromosomal replication initiator protein DnaA [Patescibacteria group bacterium]